MGCILIIAIAKYIAFIVNNSIISSSVSNRDSWGPFSSWIHVGAYTINNTTIIIVKSYRIVSIRNSPITIRVILLLLLAVSRFLISIIITKSSN